MIIKIPNVANWYDFDADSQQANECFKANVDLMLLSCGNTDVQPIDQSPETNYCACFKETTLEFELVLEDGDDEDYESVVEGLEITLNDTLGRNRGVMFGIEILPENKCVVTMVESEETVYA